MENSENKGCNIEFPLWARYPDAKCINGYLYDMDSWDEELGGFTSGGDEPCPICHPEAWLDNCETEEEGERTKKWIENLKNTYGNPKWLLKH